MDCDAKKVNLCLGCSRGYWRIKIYCNEEELIFQKQFCGWGLIRGEGLLNLEVVRSTRKYPISLFSMKYVDLKANRYGIKNEEVGQLFWSTIRPPVLFIRNRFIRNLH